jgi:hypothetical protein
MRIGVKDLAVRNSPGLRDRKGAKVENGGE